MLIEDTKIRFAHLSDAQFIAAISKEHIEYDLRWRYTPKKIKNIIKNNTKNIVVSKTDGNLSGFGVMTYHEEQANLDLLAILPQYRRKSIGTQIEKWLEKVALIAGIYNIFVQVREQNTDAIKFYESLGYVIIDKKEKYYNKIESGLMMSKILRKMFNAT